MFDVMMKRTMICAFVDIASSAVKVVVNPIQDALNADGEEKLFVVEAIVLIVVLDAVIAHVTIVMKMLKLVAVAIVRSVAGAAVFIEDWLHTLVWAGRYYWKCCTPNNELQVTSFTS